MPNYTEGNDRFYLPTDPDDSFQDVFLAGMSENFRKIERRFEAGAFYSLDNESIPTDGSADTQAALMAALDKYGSISLKKGGTYLIKSPLTGKNISIDGNGAQIISDFSGPALNFAGELLFSRSVTADYTAGQMQLTLNDTTGIEPGQIIHIKSTEIYNSERDYYVRGGNALITHIDSNIIYISHSFPASMSAANINVCEIYDPAQVDIKDLDITCSLPLAAAGGTYGIQISEGANCSLERVSTDNFITNIHLDTCVNPLLKAVRTRRAYYSGTGTSYGILNNSCTGLLMIFCSTGGGRHGYTSGGEEPVIGTTAINCAFMAETAGDTVAFDTHGNNASTHLIHCFMDRFGVNGNVKFDFCTFGNGSNPDNQIYPGETYERASYEFRNCRFKGAVSNIKVVGYAGVYTATRKYIGKIIVESCEVEKDLAVIAQLEDTIYQNNVKAEIRTVELKNINSCRFLSKDNIGRLIYTNCGYSLDNAQIFQTSGIIYRFKIEDSIIANRYLALQITNYQKGHIARCELTNVGSTSGRINIGAGDPATLNVIDTDFSGLAQGWQYGALGTVNIQNSPVKWYTAPAAVKKFTGDVMTDSAGKHWKLTVNTSGAFANVAYA